eukprot:268507_1
MFYTILLSAILVLQIIAQSSIEIGMSLYDDCSDPTPYSFPINTCIPATGTDCHVIVKCMNNNNGIEWDMYDSQDCSGSPVSTHFENADGTCDTYSFTCNEQQATVHAIITKEGIESACN